LFEVIADKPTVVINSVRDVFKIVNTSGKGTRNTHWILVATLLSFAVESYDIGGFAVAVPSLKRSFGLSPIQVGNLTAIVGISAFLAAVIGGYYADRVGRLKLFIVDMVCFLLAAVIGAFAPNIWVLMFARFLMGVGIGMDVPAAMTFIAECTSRERKRTVANKYIVWVYYLQVGVYFLALFLLKLGAGDNLWRWIIGLGAIPASVVILMRYFHMQESAIWLACQGNLHEAANVLTKTVGVNVVVAHNAVVHRRKFAYGALFRQPLLIRTVSCGSINFFQSLVYFSVVFYLPVVATGLFGHDYVYALAGIGIIQIFGLFGGMTSSALANRLGLRWETIVGYAVEVILLLFLGYGATWLSPITGAFLIGVFIFFHTFGPGQTGVSMSALSYPTELRGQGTGLSYGVGRFGAVIGFYIFPLALSAYGLGHTLEMLAVIPFLGLVVISLISWDPSGTEAEMEDA
jgi:MFS transporter, putative metabolite transport protein